MSTADPNASLTTDSLSGTFHPGSAALSSQNPWLMASEVVTARAENTEPANISFYHIPEKRPTVRLCCKALGECHTLQVLAGLWSVESRNGLSLCFCHILACPSGPHPQGLRNKTAQASLLDQSLLEGGSGEGDASSSEFSDPALPQRIKSHCEWISGFKGHFCHWAIQTAPAVPQTHGDTAVKSHLSDWRSLCPS